MVGKLESGARTEEQCANLRVVLELGSGVGIGEWWESGSTVRGLKSGVEMVER